MRNLFAIAVAAAALHSNASAGEKESYCLMIADMAQMIAEQRDQGIPRSSLATKIVLSDLHASTRIMMLELIKAIYVDGRKLSPEQIWNESLVACMRVPGGATVN